MFEGLKAFGSSPVFYNSIDNTYLQNFPSIQSM